MQDRMQDLNKDRFDDICNHKYTGYLKTIKFLLLIFLLDLRLIFQL